MGEISWPPPPSLFWPCGKVWSKIIPQISGATSELQSTRFSFMASFRLILLYTSYYKGPFDWHQLIDFRGGHFSLHMTYIHTIPWSQRNAKMNIDDDSPTSIHMSRLRSETTLKDDGGEIPKISRKRLAIQFPAVKSPLYLMKNLPKWLNSLMCFGPSMLAFCLKTHESVGGVLHP